MKIKSFAVIAVIAVATMPFTAHAQESRVRSVVQPGQVNLPAMLDIPTYGIEAEFAVPGTAVSLGGLYLQRFAYDNVAGLPGPRYHWDGPVARTVWGRYRFAGKDGWSVLAGGGIYPAIFDAVVDNGSSGSSTDASPDRLGVVVGVGYRASLGPVCLQVSPNVVLSNRLDHALSYGASGLAWLELGVRMGPVELSVDPLPRVLRASWVF
jgi:hypothetical protein